MDFVCPVCEKRMSRELAVVIPHTESHIIDHIKEKHPDWAGADGICKKCYEYYKKALHPE